MQLLQRKAVLNEEYVPATHSVHTELPTALDEPARQLLQETWLD